MADLTRYPLQGGWSSTLTQDLDGSSLTIFVADTPDFTFPAGVTTLVVLNPTKSTREVADIESYDAGAKTITIKAGGRNVSQGNGVTTSAQSHASGSTLLISNSAAIWEDLATAVNSKASTDGNNTWTGTNTFSDAVDFTDDDAAATLKIPNMTTAVRDTIASPAAGMLIHNTTTGANEQYYSGAWNTIDTGTPIGNASETVAGKVELATLAEQGAQTSTGGTGSELVLQSKNTLKTPATYTPAFLTGGTGATSVIETWNAVSDGSVRITIDGTQRDVSGLDFSLIETMGQVATTIQAGIRALTSSTETVVWSTDHFIVSSVLTTSSSAITVTSSAGVGTDISGAGGTAFMDADTGQGTVTNAVLDQTQDEDKVPVLNGEGKIDATMTYVNPFPFGDGSDGDLVVSSGTTTLDTSTVYNYRNVTIESGATLSATGGGVLKLKCIGTFDISGDIDLSGDTTLTDPSTSPTTISNAFVSTPLAPGAVGAGGDGGNGGRGSQSATPRDSYGFGGSGASGYGGGGGGGGQASSTIADNGGDGGDGGYPGGLGGAAKTDGGLSAGGGGGSAGGFPGVGGDAYGNDGADATAASGSGGGGGGGGQLGYSGTSLDIYAVAINGSGTINVSGGTGGDGGAGGDGGDAGSTEGAGGGGGGGGGGGAPGAVSIVSQNTFAGTITVTGGIGGSGGAKGLPGSGGEDDAVAGTNGGNATDGASEIVII